MRTSRWLSQLALPTLHKYASRRLRRLASTAAAKTYSETLLLPKTAFPLWADPAQSEVPFREKTCERLYKWQWENNASGPLFVLHDGPPYANGHLHIGHALNKILKDIINRYHVLLGHRVHFIPGWDCRGLPIENKALQELGKDPLTLAPSTIRDAALAIARREIQTQRDEFMQLGIMADWHGERGTYRTLDHDYEMRQLRIFQRMVEKELIYTAHRPVAYSPSSRSALAEAELEYSDSHVSTSVYIAYALDSHVNSVARPALPIDNEARVELLVWTTTPWTLSANMAIAIHPEMMYAMLRSVSDVKRYTIVARERVHALADILGQVDDLGDVPGSDLVGLTYRPLFPGSAKHEVYRVVPAPHVTATSGTGLVHCAPAHGVEDYNAFRALGMLPRSVDMVCHVDLAGKFTEDISAVVGEDNARRLVGLEALYRGGKEMVEILRELNGEHGGGRLVREEKIRHRYPYDWKTGKPIIILATQQWFANLEGIKDQALRVLDDVKFFPASSRQRLTAHVKNRSEWCISRQRVWGVPIPSLHHIDSGRAVLDTQILDHILTVLDRRGVKWWWDGPVDDFVPDSLKDEGGWRKGTDTMDVWFDSGTSWSMLRDTNLSSDGRSFDADVCLEGSDQHRGWFQSMLLTTVGSSSPPAIQEGRLRSPYAALITHGMVLDERGKKMSKSLGNIISPTTIINGGLDKKKQPAHGADLLRLWVATVDYGNDICIGPTVLASCAEALRRIRNSARFILGNLGAGGREPWERMDRSQLSLADKYVLHELQKLEIAAKEGYESYNFPRVVNAVTQFATSTLSSFYFDITKDCLYAHPKRSPERRAVLTVLEQVLKKMTSIVAPILPHLAEEIYFHHGECKEDKCLGTSVFFEQWGPMSSTWCDPCAEIDMNILLRLRVVVLALLERARAQKQVRSPLEAVVDLIIPSELQENPPFLGLLQREENLLKTLFIVSDATLVDEGSLGTTSPEWIYVDTFPIPDSSDFLAVRIRPAELHKCPRCWTYTSETAETLCGRCADACSR